MAKNDKTEDQKPAANNGDPFSQFKIERKVTVPLLKQAEGEKVAIYFISNIYRGRELKVSRSGAERKKPASLAKVLNLLTGEIQSFICATVLQSELNENYPDQGYVGKAFVVTRGAKKTGGAGAYNTYNVDQIRVPENIKVPATEKIDDMYKEPSA